MLLFEIQTMLPYPIEDVFALTVNLEKAPRWHSIFREIHQLTPNPIGMDTRWSIKHIAGSFVLEIVDFQPPYRVSFKGSRILGGTVPHFTVEFNATGEGTQILYRIHPDIPRLLKPVMAIIAPPWGKHDLARYFRELKTMLAASTSPL